MKKEQIIEFLKSDDLEMVKLGAVYMQKFLPKRLWAKILASCKLTDQDQVAFNGPWTYSKWDYKIEGKIITILEQQTTTNASGPGLWQQLGSGYKSSYTIKTGTAEMQMIQEALKNYLTNNKPTRNEQAKKKRYRKQTR